MRRQRIIRRQVMCRQHASSGDNGSSEDNALQVMCRQNASSGDNASSDDNASSGNCRRNASSGGIMCLAMCRPKASSASAGMLIPPLRALCYSCFSSLILGRRPWARKTNTDPS